MQYLSVWNIQDSIRNNIEPFFVSVILTQEDMSVIWFFYRILGYVLGF